MGCATAEPFDNDDREAVALALEELAARTADPRFRTAAGIIRGRRPGRSTRDDADALAEMGWLLRNGRARTIPAAARLVAKSLREPATVKSVADRLERKYRRMNAKASDAIS